MPAAPQKKADWATFGFDLQRVGFNPNESVIGVANAATLHQRWRADLGGPSVTAPVVAKDVEVAGAIADLVYVGSESGDFFALRAASGDVVWQREVGSVQTKCEEFPGGLHGVSGSPTLDRSAGLVYVAGGTGKVFALGLATGKVAKGWPVTITTEPEKDHVYGALALRGHLLYATTAGICEPVPFRGTLIAIDVRRARVVATFHPTGEGGVSGGGLWGSGGVSIDAAGDVFVATGNARIHPEHFGFGEQVVRLSRGLKVKAANYPGVTGVDSDFGATPLLYEPTGCPPQLVAVNKDGELFVYDRGSIGNGPRQRLRIAEGGQLQGIPAYWPEKRMMYVVNPSDSPSGKYRHGLLAFEVRNDCKLELVWQHAVGVNRSIGSPPTVANGVVYFAVGFAKKVFAFDALTGRELWNSGSAIQGSIYTQPVVVNGQLYAGSWNHFLYAFGPDSVTPSA